MVALAVVDGVAVEVGLGLGVEVPCETVMVPERASRVSVLLVKYRRSYGPVVLGATMTQLPVAATAQTYIHATGAAWSESEAPYSPIQSNAVGLAMLAQLAVSDPPGATVLGLPAMAGSPLEVGVLVGVATAVGLGVRVVVLVRVALAVDVAVAVCVGVAAAVSARSANSKQASPRARRRRAIGRVPFPRSGTRTLRLRTLPQFAGRGSRGRRQAPGKRPP